MPVICPTFNNWTTFYSMVLNTHNIPWLHSPHKVPVEMEKTTSLKNINGVFNGSLAPLVPEMFWNALGWQKQNHEIFI